MAIVVPTLCWGCRIITEAPIGPSDWFPGSGPPPDGTEWERFDCERCGVEDVRLREAED